MSHNHTPQIADSDVHPTNIYAKASFLTSPIVTGDRTRRKAASFIHRNGIKKMDTQHFFVRFLGPYV